MANVIDRLEESLGAGPHADFNSFLIAVERDAERNDVKLTAKRLKLLQSTLAARDEAAMPVIKKVHRGGKVGTDSLYGRFSVSHDGKPCVVEYEPDPDLRDTEEVPLLEVGGVEAFFRREVLPYVPDAWVDQAATKIGYEISFTRYFYKPQTVRTLEEIRADIVALERETEGLLAEIVGGMG